MLRIWLQARLESCLSPSGAFHTVNSENRSSVCLAFELSVFPEVFPRTPTQYRTASIIMFFNLHQIGAYFWMIVNKVSRADSMTYWVTCADADGFSNKVVKALRFLYGIFSKHLLHFTGLNLQTVNADNLSRTWCACVELDPEVHYPGRFINFVVLKLILECLRFNNLRTVERSRAPVSSTECQCIFRI